MLCTACGASILDARFCSVCGAEQPRRDSSDPLLRTIVAERFQVIELIAEGGMGRVYLAEQTSLGRKVALKVLKPHLLGDSTMELRFQREGRSAARLRHPNVVEIYDLGVMKDGSLFIAMEYLEGPSLARVLTRIRKEKRGPLSWREMISIAEQVAAALEEAHRQGIIHRDLKPENIVLESRDGNTIVKVLDFGIAKLVDVEPEEDGARLTKAGNVCGTPEYMSPEQVRGDTLDARSDVYAMGCILYELLTGNPPFQAGNATGIMVKHLNESPAPPREVKPDADFPPALEALCLAALAKDREKRPVTAAVFREELRKIRRDPNAVPYTPFVITGGAADEHDTASSSPAHPATDLPFASTASAVVPDEDDVRPTISAIAGEVLSTADVIPVGGTWQTRKPLVIAGAAAVMVIAVAALVFIPKKDTPPVTPAAIPSSLAPVPADFLAAPEPVTPEEPPAVQAEEEPTLIFEPEDSRPVGDSKKAHKKKAKRGKKPKADSLDEGRELARSGKYREATAFFEYALTREPGNAEIHFHLGSIFTRTSKPKLARKHLEAYLASGALRNRTTAQGMLSMLKSAP